MTSQLPEFFAAGVMHLTLGDKEDPVTLNR
jgi:hypothetical protein